MSWQTGSTDGKEMCTVNLRARLSRAGDSGGKTEGLGLRTAMVALNGVASQGQGTTPVCEHVVFSACVVSFL